MKQSTGYALEFRVVDDPEKRGYWKELFPTADDWQTIQDRKVTEALEEAGDIAEIVRRIDHRTYFKSKSHANAFIGWCRSEGFELQQLKRTKPLFGDWRVRFYRADSSELGGDYDGWETSVEKGNK